MQSTASVLNSGLPNLFEPVKMLTTPMAIVDIYALLSIPRDANDEQIRAAFIREIKQSHPDISTTATSTRAQELIEARAILLDTERRRAYDASLSDAGLVRVGSGRPPRWIFVCSQGLGEYLTIHEALQKADDGDKIYVLPGTYREPMLRIEKKIEVVGQPANGEEVILEPSEDGIYIAGDGATLRGIVINTALPRSFGVITSCHNAATISSCHFTAPEATGIVVADGSVLVEGCSFVSCLHGIRVDNAHAAVLGSSFTSNTTGILLRSGSDCVVENNEFVGCVAAAIEAQADSNVAISRNRLSSCAAGIVLTGPVRGIVEQNSFAGLDQARSVIGVDVDVTVAILNNRYEP